MRNKPLKPKRNEVAAARRRKTQEYRFSVPVPRKAGGEKNSRNVGNAHLISKLHRIHYLTLVHY